MSAASLALTTPLPTSSGGTGLSSFTQYGIFYASDTSTVAQTTSLKWQSSCLAINAGANAPGYNLEVVGSFRFQDTFAQNGYEYSPGTTNILTSYNRTSGTWLTLRQRALSHEFYCNGSSTVNIDSGGNIVPQIAAKGVNFTANSTGTGSMSSQLLNWYEEGTWTPTLGGTATYASRTARYTRIGRQVTLSCDMTVGVIGTGSTTLISGLPWSAGAFFNAGSVSYWSNTNGNYIYITPLLAYGSIQFNTTASATSAISDTTAIFKNDTRVIFTLTYFV